MVSATLCVGTSMSDMLRHHRFFDALETGDYLHISPADLKVGYCQDIWHFSIRVFPTIVSIYQRFLVDTYKELDLYQPLPV